AYYSAQYGPALGKFGSQPFGACTIWFQHLLFARWRHKVHALEPVERRSHVDLTAFNRDRCREFGTCMMLAVEVHIGVVVPVEKVHTHSIGSWLAILRFHGCIEQGTLQHLPPPKRLQLVPITGLDFLFPIVHDGPKPTRFLTQAGISCRPVY